MTTTTAPAANGTSGYIGVTAPDNLIGAPGVAGFMSVIDPEDKFGDGLAYKLNLHLTVEAQAALAAKLHKHVIEPLWPKMLAELEKAKKKAPKAGWQMPDAEAWVDDHMKLPGEKSKNDTPFLQLKLKAEYKEKKTGVTKLKTLSCFDAHNKPLDLRAINPWSGTTLQPILRCGLFVSGIQKEPALTVSLQGLRIINLITGGNRPAQALGDISEEDLALLGDTELSDLSGYAKGAQHEDHQTLDAGFDADEDLPF